MPTVRTLIDFLTEIGQAQTVHCSDPALMDVDIKCLVVDQSAQTGDMSWMSGKSYTNTPDRYRNYRGSLLIAPKDVSADTPPEHAVAVIVPIPRLAFTRIANKYFSDLLHPVWPKPGESPIAPDAKIHPSVVLSYGVVIGSNVEIAENVVIGPNTCIANARIAKDVVIGANCTIGATGFGFEIDENDRYWRFPQVGKVIIHEGVEIDSNVCIDKGALTDTVVGRYTKVSDQVHIGHGSTIGENCMIITHTIICGSAKIGNNVWLAPGSSILNSTSVGDKARLTMSAAAFSDVPAGSTVIGNPARLMDWNKKG